MEFEGVRVRVENGIWGVRVVDYDRRIYIFVGYSDGAAAGIAEDVI